jgi:hypothetical protein
MIKGKPLFYMSLGQRVVVNHFQSLRRGAQSIALGFGLLAAQNVCALAPTFLWRTNVGANFLAVDAQTNVYLSTGSKIINLNSAGTVVQTNDFHQTNSVVQRGATGDYYYFAGIRPAGISGNGVDYGTTNACFLTTYTSAGVLVRSNGFGPTGFLKYITLTDLQVDTDGNAYVGYFYNTSGADFTAKVAKLDSTGATLWNIAAPKGTVSSTSGSTRLTVLSPTNGLVLTYADITIGGGPCYAVLSSFDSNGTAMVITNWSQDADNFIPLVQDAAGNFYTRETNITKRAASGAVMWQFPLLYDYPLGTDPAGGVYTGGGPTKIFSRYDANGNLAWSTNFYYSGFWCSRVIVDQSGNRFLSLSDGSIACIAGPAFLVNSKAGDGLSPQGFRFSLASDPNAVYEIRCSSNFTTWDSLGFVTNYLGQTQVLDPSAVNSANKLYKFIQK